MILFDSHLHTHNSHDGQITCDIIAEEAINRNLSGICITDHFDSGLYSNTSCYNHIRRSLTESKNSAKKYADKLTVCSGVELGDYCFGKEIAQSCLKELNFDFVLCSTHARLIGKKLFKDFPGLKAFGKMSDDDNKLFVKAYFDYILEAAKELDFDSLAHLTYPLRYIVAVNKKSFDITLYYDIIREILDVLIKREKALEINTSCLATEWKYTLPDFDIVSIYYQMGGRLITLGSDAHFTERIGIGFMETLSKLNELGFDNYYYYKARKPVAINIK